MHTRHVYLVVPSCIRGYHVYGEIWTAVLNEQLSCESEIGTGTQWQQRMTRVLQWGTCHGKYLDILMEGGTITATVTGRRRYCDLAQGGHREFTDRTSNKITRHINNTDFNDANWIKHVIKILASITRPTVASILVPDLILQ